MPTITDAQRAAAQAYVEELYRELAVENVSNLGTQNQAIDFILKDADLVDRLMRWAHKYYRDDQTTVTPPQRLPQGELYERVAAYMSAIMEPPKLAKTE